MIYCPTHEEETMKHSDVQAALELVVEEVGKESQRICDAGSEALRCGKLGPATKAIAYAKKLKAFEEDVRALGGVWAKLRGEIDEAAPEVREIVLPTKVRSRKGGYVRRVEHVSPKTNFHVLFPDGTVIEEKTAKAVFAKTIEKIGAESVAGLNIVMAAEPLLSRDRKVFRKVPSQLERIAGGWYVKTHSSTAAKRELLEKIAARLGVSFQLSSVPPFDRGVADSSKGLKV